MNGMESRGTFSLPLLTPTTSRLESNLPLEYVTTPPLPSSSPAPLIEHMEVSPLPHKTPFSYQMEVNSPPTSTPCLEDMMLDSPAPIPRQSLDLPKPPSFAE